MITGGKGERGGQMVGNQGRDQYRSEFKTREIFFFYLTLVRYPF